MSAQRISPNWLKSYIDYTRHSEAPDHCHFWTGVSTIAGALRRRVWIDQRFFQWVPNFYIILVGPAGIINKSTTLNIGMNLLREVEGIHFGPKVITWQALLDKLQEARDLVEMVPGSMEFHPMSCITCPVSELGTFLKPSNTEMVDVMTDLWDGQVGVFNKVTRTSQANQIENPWVNVIGCTTPAWLKENFPEYMIGGGLTSRCVFVYGDQKRQLVPYLSEAIDVNKFHTEGAKLIEDLRAIADLRGEYELSRDAIEWGTNWYAQHWATRPIHMASERFSGYLARKQTHIHKLAMVLAASHSDELVITAEHLATADRCVTALESDMTKVFESIGVGASGRQLQEVAAIIRSHKRISGGDLLRKVMNIMSAKELDDAVNSLIRSNAILCLSQDGTPYYSMLNDPYVSAGVQHPPQEEHQAPEGSAAEDPPPQEKAE